MLAVARSNGRGATRRQLTGGSDTMMMAHLERQTFRTATLVAAGLICAVALTAAPAFGASKFKAKYYPECYQPLGEARDMVEPPPADVAGTMRAAGEVAGVLGQLGGFGGLGGLGKTAQTATQVAKASNLIADATQFTQKMQQDFPDPAARLAAYGDRMGQDADTIGEATLKIDGGQACYEQALVDLAAGIESGEIKSKDASARQKEIAAGLEIASETLTDARGRMDTNSKSFNDALSMESTSLGLDFATIGQAVAIGSAASNMVGSVGGGGTDEFGMTPEMRQRAAITRLGNYGPGYDVYRAQAMAYVSTWQTNYNQNGSEQAATQAALAAVNGPTVIKPYQTAYWARQAQAGAKAAQGGSPVAAMARSPLANLGTLKALSGLSGGGGAWVGANLAVGAVSDAMRSGDQASAPQPAPQAAGGINPGQTIMAANALRGASGTGAAVIGGNMLLGMVSQASNSGAQPPAPPTPAMTEAVEASLMKASIDSSRLTDAYGMVDLQALKNAELMELAKAKLK